MKQEKLIWFAIVFSTFIYAVIVYTIAPNPQGTFGEAVQRNQLTLILYLIAFGTFIAANVVPKTLRGPARVKLIVALSLFEACVIYGLVAAFFERDWRLFIPTWILGLVGMWRVYPSDDAAVPV